MGEQPLIDKSGVYVIAEGSVVPLEPLALWTILCIRWPLLAEYLRDRARCRTAVPPTGGSAAADELAEIGQELGI